MRYRIQNIAGTYKCNVCETFHVTPAKPKKFAYVTSQATTNVTSAKQIYVSPAIQYGFAGDTRSTRQMWRLRNTDHVSQAKPNYFACDTAYVTLVCLFYVSQAKRSSFRLRYRLWYMIDFQCGFAGETILFRLRYRIYHIGVSVSCFAGET